MLLQHWRKAPWRPARWPNFSPVEVACRETGEYYHDPASFDCLQRLRDALGAPLRLNSGHRSAQHNARVGGAPLSAHLEFAADISLDNHDPILLAMAARQAGFTSFGFYRTFLHVDRRPSRRWYGSQEARSLWKIWSA